MLAPCRSSPRVRAACAGWPGWASPRADAVSCRSPAEAASPRPSEIFSLFLFVNPSTRKNRLCEKVAPRGTGPCFSGSVPFPPPSKSHLILPILKDKRHHSGNLKHQLLCYSSIFEGHTATESLFSPSQEFLEVLSKSPGDLCHRSFPAHRLGHSVAETLPPQRSPALPPDKAAIKEEAELGREENGVVSVHIYNY